MINEYSFCETTNAYLWHIRRLSKAGRKLGGGADTPTLCGLTPSWDVNCEITTERLQFLGGHLGAGRRCSECVKAYNTEHASSEE